MADPTGSRGEIQPSSSSGGIERLYAEQRVNPAQSSEKPWKSNAEYFQSVQFSATAVMEMAIHAKKGDTIEVMGLLMGKIEGTVFYVLDVFPIPVEGTETRVNAQSQANEYIIKYLETLRESGNNDYVVGWYHSHPGYGCWLSGIDVNTQTLNQQFQDPFLAVVIDPHETIKMGEVSIGGFRTYPEDYSGSSRSRSQQSIPLEKIEDYGFHADKYYEVSKGFFKTESDEVALYIIQKEHWADLLAHGSSGRMKDSIVINEMKQLSEKVGHAMQKRKDETRKSEIMTANRPGAGKIDVLSSNLKSVAPRGNQLAVLSWNDTITDVVKDLLFL